MADRVTYPCARQPVAEQGSSERLEEESEEEGKERITLSLRKLVSASITWVPSSQNQFTHSETGVEQGSIPALDLWLCLESMSYGKVIRVELE